ncbi:hypothetical protein RISK_005231 [Rhodopirellula islandica]|uniref:Uncharacterized protein n=1 Tax=Rhodopirellula islandica TaxID=595434 RepID=A0A0J1B7Z9_RHOIS|nr:hypothetical protein RISK_005231 [Rhodopirellula islandica]
MKDGTNDRGQHAAIIQCLHRQTTAGSARSISLGAASKARQGNTRHRDDFSQGGTERLDRRFNMDGAGGEKVPWSSPVRIKFIRILTRLFEGFSKIRSPTSVVVAYYRRLSFGSE